jgi:hypothetical protein
VKPATATQAGYGRGWSVNTASTIWHDGTLAGTQAILVRPDDGRAWCAVCNTGRPERGEAFRHTSISGRSFWARRGAPRKRAPMTEFSNQMLVDRSGEEIGKIDDVIADPFDLRPEWLVVKIGRFAGEHLVPIAAVTERGDRFVVDFTKEDVKSAPKTKTHTAPTAEEREAVYRHYGLPIPADRRRRAS